MSEILTAEQLLLLENLTYMDDKEPLASVNSCEGKCKTIGEWINKIDMSAIDDNYNYSTYTSGADWKKIIEAVKSDETLMNMQINTANVDSGPNGGGGRSAVFVNPSTGEAVVAFRGTAEHEWIDNFVGGGTTNTADGVSTPQQENALNWYRDWYENGGCDYDSITVIGHSKGGNKAKYITVMDDTVDRCVSFDGQGFSDEFMDAKKDKIAVNQDKITNYNVENDYVNILLNDIGNKIYCEGYDYGEGGVLEAHCPNTFFKFNEDGSVEINKALGGQNGTMKNIDEFFNSYLRTLPEDEKVRTLEAIGRMAELFLGEGCRDIDRYLAVLKESDNAELLKNLLGYLVDYLQGDVPKNGEDMTVTISSGGTAKFCIYPAKVGSCVDEFMELSKELSNAEKRINEIAGELEGPIVLLRGQLRAAADNVGENASSCRECGVSLKNILRAYENTEVKILETDITSPFSVLMRNY